MDPTTDATGGTDPNAVDFVRFCYRRRRVGWPDLYDEMCSVANRGLYRGYDVDDLAGLGIGFSLFGMPSLAVLTAKVMAEEHALRRPVAVIITPDTPVVEIVTAPRPPTVDAHDEESFDIPIRLAMVPSGA